MSVLTNKHLSEHMFFIDLLNITKLKLITSVIKSRGLKFHGHIKRSTHGLSKLCLEGKPVKEAKVDSKKKHRLDNAHLWAGLDLYSLNYTVDYRTL